MTDKHASMIVSSYCLYFFHRMLFEMYVVCFIYLTSFVVYIFKFCKRFVIILEKFVTNINIKFAIAVLLSNITTD